MTPSPSYRKIKLTQGKWALVSCEDYQDLSQFNWYACWNERLKAFYAYRNGKSSLGEPRISIPMHRHLLGLKPGDGVHVDHKNRKTLDNRRQNLRLATRSQNNANCRVRSSCKSGMKGVQFHRRSAKWTSRITVSGRVICLGYFRTKTLAHRAYRDAAIKHYGEFARF